MGAITKIAWTDSTFSPWIGCTKIGDGCTNCYAEAMDARRRWDGGTTHWGAGVPRYRTSASNWAQPLAWNRKAAASGKPWRVFCASLADIADNEIPEAWRIDLQNLIARTRDLSWLLVTKRIGNMPKLYAHWCENGFPDNVRLLITVCNQDEADRDIPKLLALPCKNGISYEPALGPVDFTKWLQTECYCPCHDGEKIEHTEPCCGINSLDWIIVGGESGSKARTFDVEWARSTIAQCRRVNVPVFMKQCGARPYAADPSSRRNKPFRYKQRYCDDETGQAWIQLTDRAGADPSEWPEDLRVREFPQ